MATRRFGVFDTVVIYIERGPRLRRYTVLSVTYSRVGSKAGAGAPPMEFRTKTTAVRRARELAQWLKKTRTARHVAVFCDGRPIVIPGQRKTDAIKTFLSGR